MFRFHQQQPYINLQLAQTSQNGLLVNYQNIDPVYIPQPGMVKNMPMIQPNELNMNNQQQEYIKYKLQNQHYLFQKGQLDSNGYALNNKPKLRAIGSVNNVNIMGSNKNVLVESNANSSSSSANIQLNPSTTAYRPLPESLDEKLAITGNIFQRREDWSIIYKLPLRKQNTIHMRLEDEGPYGNDEIRCFILSHFSSLSMKNLTCVSCSCDLVIYDRFPLVDGTLFVSPFDYDKNKSVPAVMSGKSLFIYAVCLKCLNKEQDHDLKCKFCNKSWQMNGGDSLQIGTLYKYDIFAAFPCCQQRLTCNNCNNNLLNADLIDAQSFSYFSEERQCQHCKINTCHFIKPLEDIYLRSK